MFATALLQIVVHRRGNFPENSPRRRCEVKAVYRIAVADPSEHDEMESSKWACIGDTLDKVNDEENVGLVELYFEDQKERG